MNGFAFAAATAGVLLGVAVPVADPTPAARGPQPVPCPIVTVPTPSNRPAPPPPPAPPPERDRSRPVIGGAALGTTGLAAPPGAPALPTTLSARYWVVADLDSGAVLGACGAHEYATPASVQKLLLAATLLPKLDPAQVATVIQEDLNYERGSSAVGLLLGGQYTVDTLWLGLMLTSGNDAANVLARLGGGAAGVPGTIAAMNAEARRLGADETHAVTPHGLDGPGQFTSAYDLALIARACFARDDFRRITATQRAQIPPQPPKDPRGFQIQNNNQLLTHYPGALGGKTGFTEIARHTYVGAAQRNGRRLVATVLGAEAQPVRAWQQAAALLDWGFTLPADASVGRLVTPEEADRIRNPRRTPSAAPARGARGAPAGRDRAADPADSSWTSSGTGITVGVVVAVLTTLLGLVIGRRRQVVRRRRLRAHAGDRQYLR